MTFNVNKIEDDEVPFMETMTKRLFKRDLKIITAFSGEEALHYLIPIRHPVDVSFSITLQSPDKSKHSFEILPKVR